MGNLSDRVMNMKFMRKTDSDKEDVNKEEQLKKIKDMSEWVLPNSTKLIAKNKNSNVVQSIGYASINSFSMEENDDLHDTPMPANVGRKTWGEPEPKESPETKLDITKLKDSIPQKKGKKLKTNESKRGEQNKEPEPEPELDTKDFLESIWKKNNTPTDNGSKKRKAGKKEEYIPDIKNKRKRFADA